MTGASDITGNSDSALVADMSGFIAKRMTIWHDNSISARMNRLFSTKSSSKSSYGNHNSYGNILFQGMHVKGFQAGGRSIGLG
ncbi:MAG: hypothetical protein L3J71_10295 [Victivallaceae bacterium]|nr:hypothetical protein [Victivallaceae bacterium]